MAYRILIPLDGSSRSERPIPFADRLAEALHAEVELLRVLEAADVLTGFGVAAAAESPRSPARLAEAYLHDVAKRFRRLKPAATLLGQGPAGQMIATHARGGSFDLIVMSSRGHTGFTAALLGSIARAVVRESEVPVLVMRERVALPGDPRGLNVLVPLDGSALAQAVLAPLLPLARALDWRLRLVWVANLPLGDVPAQEEERAAMVAYLERLADEVRATGVGAEVRIQLGERGPAIVQVAEQEDVDLIAMSTHGRHGVARLMLGSVTEHVVLHASKPVLAVRPDAAGRPTTNSPRDGKARGS